MIQDDSAALRPASRTADPRFVPSAIAEDYAEVTGAEAPSGPVGETAGAPSTQSRPRTARRMRQCSEQRLGVG